MTQASILKSERAISLMKVAGGVLAIAASAQISIPMKPVPITFHTMVLMIIGLTYNPKLSMSTIATYLGLGALGAPVFTSFNAGLPYMMGPTGGYLAGFLFMSAFVPHFRKAYGDSMVATFINCIVAHLIMYILGVLWLGTIIGLEKAFYSGFVVFIPSGLAKMAILTGIVGYIRRAP